MCILVRVLTQLWLAPRPTKKVSTQHPGAMGAIIAAKGVNPRFFSTMNTMRSNILISALLAAGALVMGALAQPRQHANPAAPPDGDPINAMEDNAPALPAENAEALLTALKRMGEPAPQHEWLKFLAGEWKVRSTFQPGPGTGTIESTGTSRGGAIIGGRFFRLATTMSAHGVTSESEQTFGYDTRHKNYTLHAIDSFGTFAIEAAAEPEKDNENKLVFKGKLYEASPKEGEEGKTYHFEIVLDKKSDNAWTQTIRMQMQNEQWFTSSVVEFERAAKVADEPKAAEKRE